MYSDRHVETDTLRWVCGGHGRAADRSGFAGHLSRRYVAVRQTREKDIALRLNVANQTTPVTAEELHTSCQTKPFVPDAATLGTSHSLSAEDFRDLPVALVDPKKQNKKVKERDPSKTIREGKSVEDALREAFQSALFTLSDVVFDKEREHAAVQYSFHCGGLCGNGATLIFHKTANGWEQDNKLLCSFWQA